LISSFFSINVLFIQCPLLNFIAFDDVISFDDVIKFDDVITFDNVITFDFLFVNVLYNSKSTCSMLLSHPAPFARVFVFVFSRCKSVESGNCSLTFICTRKPLLIHLRTNGQERNKLELGPPKMTSQLVFPMSSIEF